MPFLVAGDWFRVEPRPMWLMQRMSMGCTPLMQAWYSPLSTASQISEWLMQSHSPSSNGSMV